MDFWQGIIIAAIAASSGAITAFVNSRIEARKKKKEKEPRKKKKEPKKKLKKKKKEMPRI